MNEYELKANEIFEKHERDLTQLKSSNTLAISEVSKYIDTAIRIQNLKEVEYWQKVKAVLKKY